MFYPPIVRLSRGLVIVTMRWKHAVFRRLAQDDAGFDRFGHCPGFGWFCKPQRTFATYPVGGSRLTLTETAHYPSLRTGRPVAHRRAVARVRTKRWTRLMRSRTYWKGKLSSGCPFRCSPTLGGAQPLTARS